MWPSSCWDWIMQERLQLFKEYKEVWYMSGFACFSWNYVMFIFCYCEYFSNTCICVCFCRRSSGCDTHCGIYQDWDEARQIPSDYLWPGWWEENPRHLEELLHNVSWRGVCGGLHWCRQDPRDKGNLNRGPRSPVHLREARASVGHSRSLCLFKLNMQNLWSQRNVSVAFPN